MRPETVYVVAKREYLQRIRSKGFWIATLVLPLFIGAVTIVPSLLAARSKARQVVAVIDETGKVAAELTAPDRESEGEGRRSRAAELEFRVEPPRPPAGIAAQQADLKRRVLSGALDAWIWIGRGVLAGDAAKPGTRPQVEYHARSVSNFVTQDVLRDRVSRAVRRVRLRDAGIDADRVADLSQPVELRTERVTETGSRQETALAGAAFGYILFLMLYMTLTIWGQQVMQGVLEEKSSRVIEVVVSAVKPFELMMGKLVGICLVGLTQFGIWLITFAVLSAPGILAALATLPEGVTLPTLSPVMIINFAFLFVLGFFVFSSFYAAIGAAFNNLQEAQQVASIAIVVLMVPVLLMFRIINDPGSTLSVVCSLIPVFTPLLMTLRIALQMPPLWQILLGYALTLAFIWGAVWMCARIYRVGILMYGKKPTLRELWKWVRYSS
jgi:ABC-2 type transport system permease protein